MEPSRIKSLRRVAHTIPSLADDASGYTYASMRLCESLIRMGVNVELAALDRPGHRPMPGYVRLFPRNPGPARLGVSTQLHQWLRKSAAAGEVGLIHTHSLWMMPCVYPGWVAKWSWTPFVVSPHGTLADAAFSSGSTAKRPFWRFVQRPALQFATCFHATARNELADIRRHGFEQPIALVPIGIEVPPLVRPSPPTRTILYLSRMHPIKQPEVLLRAWARVWRDHPGWDLRMVGSDPDSPGYLAQMKLLAKELGLERVSFDGALFGDAKLAAYREAALYVLPTKSENFGITVAEALAAGTPVIVTQGAPWDQIPRRGAGWWIEQGVEALAAALSEAMSADPGTLAGMGSRGRDWMLEEYQWTSVAGRMLELYAWIGAGMPDGDRPAWVDMAAAQGPRKEPDDRWTVETMTEVVVRMIRGESLESLSRELGVSTASLAQWRDEGLSAMRAAFGNRGPET